MGQKCHAYGTLQRARAKPEQLIGFKPNYTLRLKIDTLIGAEAEETGR
jgi:hypothetical protein